MKDNIVDYFIQMVRINSESGHEKEFAAFITDELLELGAKIEIDGFSIGEKDGSGNIFASFPGDIELEPILFCCHLDTVKPGIDIEPIIEDGIIRSKGNTILGSDDKSGIAQLLFALKKLKENNVPLPPIEMLFTSCEEIGLLGAKHFDNSVLKSKQGFALDSMKIGDIVIAAPAQNTIQIEFTGRKAHAGFEPEKGVNAIKVTAEAVKDMKLGRIDEETTANLGVIYGGQANNIVPDSVIVTGEVRSHSEEKLESYTRELFLNAQTAVNNSTDSGLKVDSSREYHSFSLNPELPYLQIAAEAFREIGVEPVFTKAGGGSDANVLNKDGIKVAVIGTGMDKVHTCEEQIRVRDLEMGTVWIEEFINLYVNSRGVYD